MNSEPSGDTETGTGNGYGDGEYDYDLTAGGPGGLQTAKDLTINVNVKINNKEYGDSYENGANYDYERLDEVVRNEDREDEDDYCTCDDEYEDCASVCKECSTCVIMYCGEFC